MFGAGVNDDTGNNEHCLQIPPNWSYDDSINSCKKLCEKYSGLCGGFVRKIETNLQKISTNAQPNTQGWCCFKFGDISHHIDVGSSVVTGALSDAVYTCYIKKSATNS